MQSVNGAQFLNITFLLSLFAAASAPAVFAADIVSLKSIHPSLWSHELG